MKVLKTMLCHKFGSLVLFFIICCVVNGVNGGPRHNGKKSIRSSKCRYTFVVNEVDTSHCPSHVQQVQADRDGFIAGLQTSRSENINIPSGPGMQNLITWLHKMENQLVGEITKNHELNNTVLKHEMALKLAQQRLHEYQSNFSSVFRTIMFMEQKLQKQRDMSRNLDQKLSGIMLDVVEVNNVLSQKVPHEDSSLTGKEIQVQSVAKIHACGVTDQQAKFKDCTDVYKKGHRTTGVYYITPTYVACPIPVWCDMDTPPGGWTLIQRRSEGTVDFNRFWQDYKDGFGNVVSEFWLGNDNIFLLTNQDHYELRIDLWDFEGNRVYALYKNFKIDGERDNYRLNVHSFEGSANDGLKKHNRMMFSTPDRDNDGWTDYHCGREWEAGWWFNNCWFAILNGPYYNNSAVKYRGISWNDWKHEQLSRTEMKIRISRLYDKSDTHNNSVVDPTISRVRSNK